MSVDTLDIPSDDPVANRLEALVGDGVVGAERVLRDRLGEVAQTYPQDYLALTKHGDLALKIAVGDITHIVRHAGPDAYEQVTVRDGVVEGEIAERRAQHIRQQINWRDGATVVEGSTVEHLFAEAARGGAWV